MASHHHRIFISFKEKSKQKNVKQFQIEFTKQNKTKMTIRQCRLTFFTLVLPLNDVTFIGPSIYNNIKAQFFVQLNSFPSGMRTDIIIKVSMILFGIFFIFRVSCLLYKTQNKVFVSFLRWDISLGMGQLLSLKAHLISGERPESHLRTKCHITMSNRIHGAYEEQEYYFLSCFIFPF